MLEEQKSANELTDQELVVKTLEDKNFYVFLVDRYEFKITHYIQRITRINDQDKEDLLQDIFIKAYLSLRNFNQELSFNAWIYRIAHNAIIDFHRKSKTQKSKLTTDIDDDFLITYSFVDEILEGIYKEEQRKDIEITLQKIKPIYREILYLRFIEEYSYSEISDIFQKTESSITTLLHRAKKEFKNMYQKKYE